MGAATLIGARLLQFSAALVLFGSPLFLLYGVETVAASMARPARWPWQRLLLLIAATVALLGTLIWVMAETASMGDKARDALNPTALWTVLYETHFGRACLVRIALLILSIVGTVAIPPSKRLWIVQALLGGAVTTSFAWTGHGASDSGWAGVVHRGADVLHLGMAGIWIGALVPLAVLVFRSTRSHSLDDARATQFGLDRFSTLGVSVVAVLILSGLINSGFLIGLSRWRALFTTVYGVTLLIKLGLFGLMVGLAAFNRYRAAPALRATLATQGATRSALRPLRATVLAETVLALLVLLAVSVMGTLAPPISGE